MTAQDAWPVEIVPVGPTTTATLVWRMRGATHVTAIVKATFSMVPEGAMTPTAPEAILRADAHHRGVPTFSARAPSDLAPYRARADVIFVGSAHAPPGATARTLVARLGVFRGARALVDKSIHVVGEREHEGAPRSFQSMPVVYERAYGGAGWEANPMGVGFDDDRQPNLIDPDDPRRTVGFGPIARAWPARRKLVGKSDRKAVDAGEPLIPDRFEWSYFQSAPPDQQTELLSGDEWIVLQALHPDLPLFRSQLPSARAVGRVHGLSSAPRPIAFAADTLLIDGDAMRCSMTFRAALPIQDDAQLDALWIAAGVELPGHPLEWPDARSLHVAEIVAPPPSAPSRGPDATVTVDAADEPPSRPATPFVLGAAPSAIAKASGVPRAAPRPHRFEGTMTIDPDVVPDPELPFAPPSQATPSAPSAPSQPKKGELEGTLDLTASAPSLWTPATPFTAGPTTPARAPLPPPKPPPPKLPPPKLPPPKLPPPKSAFEGTMAIDPDALAKPATPFSATPDVAPQVYETTEDYPRSTDPPSDRSPARFFPTLARPTGPARVDATARAVDFVPPRRPEAIPIVAPKRLVGFSLPWQIEPGRDTRTVVVKGTFDLVHGAPVQPRDDADFPSGDVFADEPLASTVLYPSDFAVHKPRVDVTLSGHAVAPGGRATEMEVRFRFGSADRGFDRRLAIFGDRAWDKRLAPGAPLAFDAMPLTWERAFGGPELPDNPVGLGHVPVTEGKPKAAPGRLPNIEDPKRRMTTPTATPRPQGVAAIPMLWRARWSKMGTYDDAWQSDRWPYFPADFDWCFFQAAPPEQQLDEVVGDETFTIAGVHPELAAIEGSLPGQRVRCFAQRTTERDGAFVEIPTRLDTIAFDTDAMKVNLVFRAVLDVSDDDASEIAEVFVLVEPLGDPPASLDEAFARYRAEKALEEDAPSAKAANENASPAEDAPPDEVVAKGAEVEARVRDAMKAAGISAAMLDGTDPTPPKPKRDPEAMVADMKAKGATDAQVAEMEAMLAEVKAAQADVGEEDARARLRDEVKAKLAAGDPLDGMDLAGVDLSELSFEGASLVGANLKAASLRGSNLVAANLGGAQMAGADLRGADLSRSNLEGADLQACDLTGAILVSASIGAASFGGAKCHGARFDYARGEQPSFVEADLTGASFSQVELSDADFSAATLDDAVFDRAVVPEIRLYDARGSKTSFVETKMPGARADDVALLRASLVDAEAPGSTWEKALLDESSFERAKLDGASFVRASCRKAIFTGASIVEGRFKRARLDAASLHGANLMKASLEGADLSYADLRGASLHAAETWKAKLVGARLDDAIVTGTKLEGES